MARYFIGIDIAFTANKVIVPDAAKTEIVHHLLMPIGLSSKETVAAMLERLGE